MASVHQGESVSIENNALTCGSYRRTKSPFFSRSTTVSGSFQMSRSLNHFSSSASVFSDAARNACKQITALPLGTVQTPRYFNCLMPVAAQCQWIQLAIRPNVTELAHQTSKMYNSGPLNLLAHLSLCKSTSVGLSGRQSHDINLPGRGLQPSARMQGWEML